MKAHYSDYVTRCLRFYCRYPSPDQSSEIEKLNWHVCKDTFETLKEEDQALLREIYAKDEPLGIAIANVAFDRKMATARIWSLVNSVEKQVARRRGLI